MNRMLKCAVVLMAVLAATEAVARGAAANIMNSPGYQRRLQESRGHVPDGPGSTLTTKPSRVYHGSKRRHR